MNELVTFAVPGEAVAKGRPRFSRNGHTYTPEKTVNYENLVRVCYKEQVRRKPFERGIPLRMSVEVYMQIPKTASKKKQEAMVGKKILPTKKPDCSNLLKSIEDGLNGVAYADDSQVVMEKVVKYYGEYPETIVRIGVFET